GLLVSWRIHGEIVGDSRLIGSRIQRCVIQAESVDGASWNDVGLTGDGLTGRCVESETIAHHRTRWVVSRVAARRVINRTRGGGIENFVWENGPTERVCA